MSIIIPVYNVEKYLQRCIDSIVFQKTSFNFEIIAVNDCSTDDSIKILSQYESEHKNFHLIQHTYNSKLSKARKSGINFCNGKYVMHVDSDDWIVNDSLQNIYNLITIDQPDIMVFNYYTEDTNGIRKESKVIPTFNFCYQRKMLHFLFLGAPWNKIVKKELLQDIIFGEIGINNGEDLVYSTEIFLKTNNILTSKYSYYIYYKNLQSLTMITDSKQFLLNQIIVLNQLSIIFKKYQPTIYELKFILNYFMKFIFIEIYNLKFSNDIYNKSILNLITIIKSNLDIQKYFIKEFNNSLKYNHLLFFYILKYFSIKKAFSLFFKNITYGKRTYF